MVGLHQGWGQFAHAPGHVVLDCSLAILTILTSLSLYQCCYLLLLALFLVLICTSEEAYQILKILRLLLVFLAQSNCTQTLLLNELLSLHGPVTVHEAESFCFLYVVCATGV